MKDAGGNGAAGRELVLSLLSGDARSVLATSRSDAEWADLLTLAGEHLHAWLAYRVSEVKLTGSIPAAAAATLQAARRAAALGALRRRDAFARTIRALDAAGINAIALKGMALAYSVYPEPWTRPMTDVDLWIDPARRADAWHCLAEAGWRVPERYRVFGPTRETNHWILELPVGRTRIEVPHIPESILARPRNDWAMVWARAERREVCGVMVGVLTLRDQIAHLAMHLVKHGFNSGLRALLDVTQLSRTVTGPEQWKALGAAHRTDGVAPWTAVTLHLARSLLAAPVPDEYFAAATVPAVPPTVVAAACEQLWDRSFREQVGFETIAATQRGHVLRGLWQHLKDYYAAPPGEGQTRLGALVQRTTWNFTSRLPRHIGLLVRGELRPGRLAYRARRQQERDALRQAVASLATPALPAGGPAPPPSSR